MENLEEIYTQYSKQVYKYLFSLTRNENLSEELTQETFYIATKKINKFKGNCKLYVWLCQIAKHLYYKELKKWKKMNIVSLDTIENTAISQENNPDTMTIQKLDTYKKINILDGQSKEIMYLRIIGNLSFKEIGEILGISENLARVKFYRGKQKIKEVD